MAYNDQEQRRSRVVVETPTARREVTQSEAVRGADRSGISGTTVGVIAVLAIALLTVLVLFLMNAQTDNANDNLATQSPTPSTTIVQQPAQQPPIIIQEAPPATQPAPIIVNPPAPSGGSTSSGSNDAAIQAEIDKKILDDPNISTLGVTVTVLNGKATLLGVVKSNAVKAQVERMVREVSGVKEIDNQITVSAG
jgi:hypothetical protein